MARLFTRKNAATPQVAFNRVMQIIRSAENGTNERLWSFMLVSSQRGNWDETAESRMSPNPPEQSSPLPRDTQEFTDRTNTLMKDQLKKDLRSMGLGYRELKGVWMGDTEPSFFVANVTNDQAIRLLRSYYQDAIIYCGPMTNGKVVLHNNDGSTDTLGVGWDMSSPEMQQLMDQNPDDFPGRSRYKGKDVVFASK